MTPIAKFVELAKVQGYVGPVITAQRQEDLDRAFRFALKTFNILYESRKGDKGSDFYNASTRTFVGATNFAVGALGYHMVGHFVRVLLETPLAGKTVAQWILQKDAIPTGASPSTYYVFPKAGDPINLQLRGAVKACPANSTEYYNALDGAVAAIRNAYGEGSGGTFSSADSQARADLVSYFYLILNSRVNRITFDSFPAYVRGQVALAMRYMIRALAPDDENLPITEFIPVGEPYNMFEVMKDENKFLEMFKNWYVARLEADLRKMAQMVYTLDLKSLKVENGVISGGSTLFDQIIDYVMKGALGWSSDYSRFISQFETLKSNALRLYHDSVVLHYSSSKVVVPLCIKKMFYYKTQDFNVTANLTEIESRVRFDLMTCDLVLKELESFVSTYFTDGFEYFPNLAVRSTVINGIRSYYRFDFSSATRETLMFMKLTPYARTNGSTEYDPEPIGVTNLERSMTKMNEDARSLPLYHTLNKWGYYGTDSVEALERNAMIHSLITSEILQTGPDSWSVHYRPVIHTIKPPLNVERSLDVYCGTNLRGVAGKQYELVELPIATQAQRDAVSMLDLWFAVRVNDVNSQADIENTYKKRLNAVENKRDFLPQYKITSVTGAKLGTPMWGALMALGGRYGSTRQCATHFVRPQYFGLTTREILKGAKDKRIAIDRKLIVKVPVALAAVNKDYIDRAAGATEIYRSGRTRFTGTKNEAPFFVLENVPFDKEAWPGYITGTFTLDLAYDATFVNAEKQYNDTNEMELTFVSGMPGFADIKPGYGEKYAVVGFDATTGKGAAYADFTKFYTSPLIKSDATSTFEACLRNLFLEMIYCDDTKEVANYNKQLQVMFDWMFSHYNLKASSPMNTLYEFRVDTTFSQLRDKFKKYDPASNRAAFIKFFKETFLVSSDAVKQIPEMAHPAYRDLLDASLYGAQKLLPNKRGLTLHITPYVEDVIKEVEALEGICTLYALKSLNLDAYNV